jgi:hypothetical protein
VGFNDIGFTNDAIISPHIDELRGKGVALTRVSVEKYTGKGAPDTAL